MLRTLRPRRLATLVIAALAALALLAAATGAAARRGAPAAAKPTVVLVHGAWADASGWDGVTRRLQRGGYTVRALANPLRGLVPDAAYVRDTLRAIRGPIVLVGHSYGGAVITNAATGLDNVEALVYVDAFALDEGESLYAVLSRFSDADITRFVEGVPIARPDGRADVDTYLTPEAFAQAFANDLPARTSAAMWAAQRPVVQSALLDRSGAPAWRSVPSWYVLGSEDHIIPPAAQRFMAQRARARLTEVRASHVSLVSKPGAVTRVVLQAARAVR
jgi:pimeloyl-ACP methyl ester carboxylesterase